MSFQGMPFHFYFETAVLCLHSHVQVYTYVLYEEVGKKAGDKDQGTEHEQSVAPRSSLDMFTGKDKGHSFQERSVRCE